MSVWRASLVLVIALAMLVMLPLSGCDDLGIGAGETEEKDPIVLGDEQWQTMWINNAIIGFIIEHGYGYPVKVETLTSPVAQESLESGDIHVKSEVWQAQVRDWWEGALDDGTVLDMGPILESTAQGWYVPRYVIEGDEERDVEPEAPGLESVFDLEDYVEVFPSETDAEQGELLSGIAQWEETLLVNEVKLHAYGLEDDFEAKELGSAAGLDSAIAGAYERGEPILAYYWEPTWLLGAYDMVRLEEPEYDQDVWDQIMLAIDGEIEFAEVEEACAYDDVPVATGVHAGLEERAPEVVEFLRDMKVGTDAMNEVAAYLELEEKDPEEGALWYFENFEDDWRDWLPENVEQNVEDALQDEGIDVGQ